VTSSLGVCWLAEFIREVWRCYPLPTLVDKDSQLIVDSLRRLQTVQLMEQRSDVLVPWRGKHQPSSRLHHELNPLQQNASNGSISVIQPCQNKSPVTGKQIWKWTSRCFTADTVRQSKQRWSSWRVTSSRCRSRCIRWGHEWQNQECTVRQWNRTERHITVL